jgi:hypothetical protein
MFCLNGRDKLLGYQRHAKIQKQLVIKHKICGLIIRVFCAECLPPLLAANYGCYILGLLAGSNIAAVFVWSKSRK